MSKTPFSDEVIERSLAHHIDSAMTLKPVLTKAGLHVKEDLARLPEGAVRFPRAEKQLAPSLIRLRTHQIILGHNLRCTKQGVLQDFKANHVRNGAVCLITKHESNFRVYKGNDRYPTPPTGKHQVALINQDRYLNRLAGDGLFPVDPNSLYLDGLIYYYLRDFEVVGGLVAIPYRFVDGRVNIVARKEVSFEADLESLAQFEQSGPYAVLSDRPTLVMGEAVLSDEPEPSEFDPHAEESSLSAEPTALETSFGFVLESEEDKRRND